MQQRLNCGQNTNYNLGILAPDQNQVTRHAVQQRPLLRKHNSQLRSQTKTRATRSLSEAVHLKHAHLWTSNEESLSATWIHRWHGQNHTTF